MSSPTGVKSAPNLGEGLPHRAKVCQISGEGFPHRAKVCQNLGEDLPHRTKVWTEFRARFHPLGDGLPEISGRKNEFGMAFSASIFVITDRGVFGLFKCLLSFVKMALSTHSDNLYRGKGIIWTSRSDYPYHRFAISEPPVLDIQVPNPSITPSFITNTLRFILSPFNFFNTLFSNSLYLAVTTLHKFVVVL